MPSVKRIRRGGDEAGPTGSQAHPQEDRSFALSVRSLRSMGQGDSKKSHCPSVLERKSHGSTKHKVFVILLSLIFPI